MRRNLRNLIVIRLAQPAAVDHCFPQRCAEAGISTWKSAGAFPLVDRGQLAFFALSTECLWDWDDYVEMMAEICKTIRWAEGADEPGRIGNVLDG
ncbi:MULTISPECIES: hypothetical protein [Prauserella salsuginis group]|uniref:Uncharacterized protein n=1 Tax=Prauserella salsuginis TaxID=387889 RepID=A0ABW6GB43_9PSEU|nr:MULTISPECIES: hypothetical protein [Prauserella salsuginis group]